VRLEGLGQLKNPMPSGIEPESLRLVAIRKMTEIQDNFDKADFLSNSDTHNSTHKKELKIKIQFN
jgi:hypothetical protein